jgi:hypothetical protein
MAMKVRNTAVAQSLSDISIRWKTLMTAMHWYLLISKPMRSEQSSTFKMSANLWGRL